MSTLKFSTKVYRDSEHRISVLVYSTRGAMRRRLTEIGHKDSSHTNAACWQGNRPGKDMIFAELYFCREFLCRDTVVHECCHAAYHRAVLLGIPLSHDNFQEWVASDTGRIVDLVLYWMEREGIPVKLRLSKDKTLADLSV